MPKRKDSVFEEPHSSQKRPRPDPSEEKAEAILRREKEKKQSHEDFFQSVHAEPAIFSVKQEGRFDRDWSCSSCGFNLKGLSFSDPCPSCGNREKYLPVSPNISRYAKWLKEKLENPPLHAGLLTSLACALAGGVFAVFGAFFESLQGTGLQRVSIGSLAVAVLVAPLTEETLKISLAGFIVERRPYLFTHASQIFLACFGSAAIFATVENLLYLNFYIPNPSEEIKIWRWTVCTMIHLTCTSVAASGLVRLWLRTKRELRLPIFNFVTKRLIAAGSLHGTYNLLASLYEISRS